MTDKPDYILFGVGTPYAYEVYESLSRDGIAVRAFVDNLASDPAPDVPGLLVAPPGIAAEWKALPVLLPLLTPGHRMAVLAEARSLGFSSFPMHCDPTAVVARTATLGDGVLVNAMAVVGAMSRIGPFSIINRSASVGHHVVLERFVTLGPGCILCGSSTIGSGTFIGAGAVINPKVNVGRNTIVGAGAVVVRDLGDRVVAVGNPARVIKEGIAGYNDVSV